MSDETRFDRREFLRASGVVATGAAVAGCTDTGGGGGNESGGGGGQEPADGANETAGNETVGNESGANETTGNETDANETAGNETDANETAGNESTGNESGGGGGTQEVIVGPNNEFVFEPEQLSISTGTTVRWIWESDTHNVAPTSQPQGASWQGHEDIESAGFEYEHTFDTPGTYEYVCTPHESQGMVGTIEVE